MNVWDELERASKIPFRGDPTWVALTIRARGGIDHIQYIPCGLWICLDGVPYWLDNKVSLRGGYRLHCRDAAGNPAVFHLGSNRRVTFMGRHTAFQFGILSMARTA